jgi:hypothetical protein
MVEPSGKPKHKPKPISFFNKPKTDRRSVLKNIGLLVFPILVGIAFQAAFAFCFCGVLLRRTCYYSHFVKLYMAQQNIYFEMLLRKGFYFWPPQTFFYTVLLQNFEVAPNIHPLSEANQN